MPDQGWAARVSLVIPAHNAAATLARALDSVLAQTRPDFEAVVVNDGSSDGTRAIIDAYAARDARIRPLHCDHHGKSSARNSGVARAAGEWLLFLDADDSILPHALERLLARAERMPDAVACGWTWLAADGSTWEERLPPAPDDVFSLLSQYCCFAIHSVLVRRRAVLQAGGFDPDLSICEEWDLWQRIARAGASFEPLPELLVRYHARPGSAGSDIEPLLENGLGVIRRGHAADSRVANPAPQHAQGRPRSGLAVASWRFLCWAAGIRIGSGRDAAPLLRMLADVGAAPELEPERVAHSLFRGALLPGAHPKAAWLGFWPKARGRIADFLAELERTTQARDLAIRAERALQELVAAHAQDSTTIGRIRVVPVEITEPIPDVLDLAHVERLRCALRLEGEPLGDLQLPVCDDHVPGRVLADAIAASYAWPVLGRFFERTIYPSLRIETAERVSVWRDAVCVAKDLTGEEIASNLHDRVGWTVFLQELWGIPTWTAGKFYDETVAESGSTLAICSEETGVMLELADDLPDLETRARALQVGFTLAGSILFTTTIEIGAGRLRAQVLRARASAGSGMELCRVAVREALVGHRLDGGPSLRERLRAACRSRRAAVVPPRAQPLQQHEPAHAAPWLQDARVTTLLGRHEFGPPGTSASRFAVLPVGAKEEVLRAADAAGQLVATIGQRGTERIIYSPDFVSLRAERRPPRGAKSQATSPRHQAADHGAQAYDRHFFETLFISTKDPWRYDSDYERLKYEQTLSLLPKAPIGHALELACAEGKFTHLLARRVQHLLATDISATALARAREACAELDNISFAVLDLTRDPLPGPFDLIVCSEVLYYTAGPDELRRVARKFAEALTPDGLLITAHCNVVVDDPRSPGFDWDVPFGAQRIGEILSKILEPTRELKTSHYRIQSFRRRSWWAGLRDLMERREPISEEVDYIAPVPEAAAHFLEEGGTVSRRGAPVRETWRLPILMYHRIAPNGSATLERYRLAPMQFEEQLRYLRDCGFRGASLEEWRLAKEAWRPLPGRAVMLTFDDGYLDFREYAWPLLQKYGFPALVFVVTDCVGRTSIWDARLGPPAPLMDWDDLRELHRAGIEFGSHSSGHRCLTALSPADIVIEAVRSKRTLEQELRRPVTAFAYPHGAEDPAIQHLIGAAGYTYGLTCRPGASKHGDSLLALPRIEIRSDLGLSQFISCLGQ